MLCTNHSEPGPKGEAAWAVAPCAPGGSGGKAGWGELSKDGVRTPKVKEAGRSVSGGGQVAHGKWTALRGVITESLHRNEGSYSIRSQQPLQEGLLEHPSPEGQQKCVSQTTLFYREGI